MKLPNLPAANVPAGKTPDDNEVVRIGGEQPQLHAGAVPHWDLVKNTTLLTLNSVIK
ncbi:hypothetical protein MKQ70_30730 [Chitinophaga sedimenti]|uniref:hypothetical protein n=1 Tax=Chitinophaga sedimenti TaxID=2033606 RepID=UPI0020046EA8|nr:hypothetical protein [Chitinophaga sedimenti]MCK7559115.1 hypothetical protein [Chitinophaga sedimenti]